MDKKDIQFINGRYVGITGKSLMVLKPISGTEISCSLEKYELNQEFFEFERVQEIKFDIEPKSVYFNNEGTMISDYDEKYYYIGLFFRFKL